MEFEKTVNCFESGNNYDIIENNDDIITNNNDIIKTNDDIIEKAKDTHVTFENNDNTFKE